jgi:hypothetical protein
MTHSSSRLCEVLRFLRGADEDSCLLECYAMTNNKELPQVSAGCSASVFRMQQFKYVIYLEVVSY